MAEQTSVKYFPGPSPMREKRNHETYEKNTKERAGKGPQRGQRGHRMEHQETAHKWLKWLMLCEPGKNPTSGIRQLVSEKMQMLSAECVLSAR